MSTQEQHNHEYSRLLQRTLRLQREAAREFHYALRRANEAVADGQIEIAVHWCRHGATIAWMSNPGFFYSHEMEQLLSDIGRSYLKPVGKPSYGKDAPKRFLHVLTTAFPTGGHTRAVSRWIDTCAQHAPSEHHSVLISMQLMMPIPAWLSYSAERSGGEVISFLPHLSVLDKAAEMRSRSTEFDAVILHIHPDDPLPNLAFYDQPRPVIFFDHADHAFSLGTDVAMVIADIRPVGHDLSVRFRSPAARKVLLPLPLPDDRHPPLDKAEVRRKLGLPVNAPIALTIGDPFKFSSVLGYSFPAMVQSICEGNPRVLIIAIGISESEPFPELKRLTGGRFMPVGFVKDRDIVELYYRTADVYLDSFPCTSITAVLDAARHGLPVQRLCNPYQRLMWCDDPGLDSVMRGACSQDEFVTGVLEWLEWPEDKRAELGSRFRTAVLREHCGASWKSNWLDPAINALSLPCEKPHCSETERTREKETCFFGLGRSSWEGEWPGGMFVAGAILGTVGVHRRIRFSGVLRSIKPLLFDTAGDGMAGKRFLMFRRLIASIKPKDVVAALRRILRAVFKA